MCIRDRYEDEMAQAREEVLREMSQRAEALGANAVIGANVGYCLLYTSLNCIFATV